MDHGQAIEARVEDLLSRMTMAENIGKITQTECGAANPDVSIEKFGNGTSTGPYSLFV